MGPIELLTGGATVAGPHPGSGQAAPVLHVCQDSLPLSSGSDYIMISDADLRSVTTPNRSDLRAEKPTGNTVKVYREINSHFVIRKPFSNFSLKVVIRVVRCVSCVIGLCPRHIWRAEGQFSPSTFTRGKRSQAVMFPSPNFRTPWPTLSWRLELRKTHIFKFVI